MCNVCSRLVIFKKTPTRKTGCLVIGMYVSNLNVPIALAHRVRHQNIAVVCLFTPYWANVFSWRTCCRSNPDAWWHIKQDTPQLFISNLILTYQERTYDHAWHKWKQHSVMKHKWNIMPKGAHRMSGRELDTDECYAMMNGHCIQVIPCSSQEIFGSTDENRT